MLQVLGASLLEVGEEGGVVDVSLRIEIGVADFDRAGEVKRGHGIILRHLGPTDAPGHQANARVIQSNNAGFRRSSRSWSPLTANRNAVVAEGRASPIEPL